MNPTDSNLEIRLLLLLACFVGQVIKLERKKNDVIQCARWWTIVWNVTQGKNIETKLVELLSTNEKKADNERKSN